MRVTSGFQKMLKKSSIKIGVLGGIGPESSARFYKLLIDGLQKEKLRNNTEYPQIIINSIPAPELFTLNKNNIRPKEYIEGLKLLDKQKTDFIIIVCNTAYAYINEFTIEIKTPIIKIPEYIYAELSKIKGNIIVIGSSVTNQQKIYFGKNLIYPNIQEQKEIDRIIFDFNRGIKNYKQQKILLKILDNYKKINVLAACTEIDILLSNMNKKYISTIDLMVKATIDKFLSIKKLKNLK